MCLCARHFFQHSFHTLEFVGQHGLEQIELPWKMGVKRFFANPQFLRQIVHGHTAEAVTEKVDPRRIDDSLPARITPSSRARFVSPFHIHDSFSTTWKLIQFIWFPKTRTVLITTSTLPPAKCSGCGRTTWCSWDLPALTNYVPNEFCIRASTRPTF